MRARVRVCEFSILDGCSQLARSYLRSHDLQYLSPCIFGALDSREYGTSAAKTSEQAVSCSCVAVVLQLCCSCVAVVLQLCCSCVAVVLQSVRAWMGVCVGLYCCIYA